MDEHIEELARRGRALSPADRSRLVDLLLESLDEVPIAAVETAWDLESESRVAAFRRGELQTVDGEQVLSKARRLAHP